MVEKPAWMPDWTGETVVIVGSGPSARDVPVELGRGRARFVALNESWRLVPWADVLFATDRKFWAFKSGVPGFRGLKVMRDEGSAVEGVERVAFRRVDDLLDGGEVGWGGGSGFQAVNLAVNCGARRLVLVGLDLTLRHGVHWHGRHVGGLADPLPGILERMRRSLDGVSGELARRGVEVLNASAISALTAYPKVSFADAFDG